MATPVVEHSGGGTDSDSTINVTIADTPTADELTILLITSGGAANLTLPSGWSWVPRCNGTAGVAGASTTSRLWAIYCIGEPPDLTQDITMSVSQGYTWDYIIVSGVDTKLPFTSARYGGSSNSAGGLLTHFPGRPWVDCMMVMLCASDANDHAFVAGTWTEQRQSTNGSQNSYIVTNVTDYTAADSDGVTSSTNFDTGSSGKKLIATTLALTPATTDLTSPLVIAAHRTNLSAVSSTPDMSWATPAAAAVASADYCVPGMLLVGGVHVSNESYTVTTRHLKIETSTGVYTDHSLSQLVDRTNHSDGGVTLSDRMDYLLIDHDIAKTPCINGTLPGGMMHDYVFSTTLTGCWWGALIAAPDTADPIDTSGIAEGGSTASYDPASRSVTTGQLLILSAGQNGGSVITEPGGYTVFTTEGGNPRMTNTYKEVTGPTDDPGAFTCGVAQYWLEPWLLVNARPTATPPSNTVAPAITGAAEEGQTLTCSTGSWDGTEPITYAYQWKYNDGTWNDIAGETSSTWVVDVSGAVDAGDTIKCTVTATNSAGNDSEDSNTTSAITVLDFTNQFMGMSVS